MKRRVNKPENRIGRVIKSKRRVCQTAVFACFAICFFSCNSDNSLVPEEWRQDDVAKVVGYRFRLPGEDSGHGDGYATLFEDSMVDLSSLEKLKQTEVELNPKQVQTLLDCIFNDIEPLPNVACYVPHHMFVFYDAEGVVRRAIEVCFECNGVDAIPPIPESQVYRHDLISLAQLCNELGIWMERESVEDYLPPFTEGWKPRKP